MSTRWYPLYQRGNPQLRVFLPNFWIKMIRPVQKQPENVVVFECSMEMTRFDVKSYLEKIYNIPVAHVRTRINLGKTSQDPGQGYVIKADDTKIAYVSMPRSEKFVFPEIYVDDTREDQEMKSLDDMKSAFRNYVEKSKDRPGMPAWFTM